MAAGIGRETAIYGHGSNLSGIVAIDAGGNVAPAYTLVDQFGVPLSLTIGKGTNSSGLRVTLATDDDVVAGHYKTVAASQTNQTLGTTGSVGDFLAGVLIIPATTAPGAVFIKDGSQGSITIFTGGTLTTVIPFFVPLGIKSTSGAWQVTTGANLSAIGVGRFT